ncbi:MAG: hypothetical protein WBO09_06165 [Methylocystis silviterrae]|uniref:hypothetical protein n=1 Tax=Methylocystis silviterrae TaxID=2743612 RepID=UPI003C768736
MNGSQEKNLIDALKKVDAHGDIAPPHVHDPVIMILRERAFQAHLIRWDDIRGRYVLTGAGRHRISARDRTAAVIMRFREREAKKGGLQE